MATKYTNMQKKMSIFAQKYTKKYCVMHLS